MKHHDCFCDALRYSIEQSKKSLKEVAAHLWPADDDIERELTRGYKRLMAGLDPDRREKLSFEEVGCICKYIESTYALEYFADTLDCDIQPRCKDKTLTDLTKRIEEMEGRRDADMNEIKRMLGHLKK